MFVYASAKLSAEMDVENAAECHRTEEGNSRERTIDGVTRKEDLITLFEQSDHSCNKIHFSEVSEYVLAREGIEFRGISKFMRKIERDIASFYIIMAYRRVLLSLTSLR